MSPIVYRISRLLGMLLAEGPVGTNLALFWLLWALLSGRFLLSRGAVFPALAARAIIAVLLPFAAWFSRPVWGHVQVLLVGVLLCRGTRTVTAVLRVMGLGQERRFKKYHRVLSRAR